MMMTKKKYERDEETPSLGWRGTYVVHKFTIHSINLLTNAAPAHG
jgi:hypothetical protein